MQTFRGFKSLPPHSTGYAQSFAANSDELAARTDIPRMSVICNNRFATRTERNFKEITMDAKTERKTNPVLQDLIQQCEEAARKNDAAIWREVAEALKDSTRQRAEVNLSHIERNVDDSETTLVVPGKVMGSGRLSEDVTVAAFDFTSSAMEAINDAGEAVYLEDLVEENPEGEGLRLIG